MRTPRPLALLPLLLSTPFSAGCERQQPAPAPTVSTPIPAPTATPTSPTNGATTAPAASAVDGGAAGIGGPRKCEVEITGTARLPAPVTTERMPYLFAAVGDCLDPNVKPIGMGGVSIRKPTDTEGNFFLEVMVPWGSDLTLCSATFEGKGKPTKLYGKAQTPMHAETSGEVEFKNVVVQLAEGPPKTFATPPGR